jgi:TonB-linked SusC/RagA family outer membrane protein
MENRCKSFVIPLWYRRFGNTGKVLRGALILLLLLGTSLFSTGNLASAQQSTVTGIVLDQAGQPVIGATVLVKGTTNGTTTGVDGKYTLVNVPADATISFSFVGYTPQEIPLNGRSSVNINLLESAIGLDEIVVVGYGTQAKKTLTGAVSSVQAEQLTSTKTSTAASALVGKVAGITARLRDARPGNSSTLQIRNYGTPLVIIDGVPSSNIIENSYLVGSTGDLNNLELDNIESISILKDGAAAIYGLQASNGVILVTTKQGKSGEKPILKLDSYYGMQGFTRFPEPANAYWFELGLVESAQNQGSSPPITAAILEKWRLGTYVPSDDAALYEDYRSFDYYEEIIGKQTPAPQVYINASAQGSTDVVNYFFSVADMYQEAVIEDYDFNRTSIQSNIEAKLSKKLKFGLQLSPRLEHRHQSGIPGVDDYPNIFNAVMRNWPTERPWANDTYPYVNNTHSVNINPATYKEEITGWTTENTRVFKSNIYLDYDFGFGLKVRGTYSYEYFNWIMECFEWTYPAYTYDRVTKTYNQVVGGGNLNPYRRTDRQHNETSYAQFQANYNKTFGKHTIGATAAYDQTYGDNQFLRVHTIPPTNYIPVQNLVDQDELTNNWNMSARASFVGRFNYGFADKYLLELVGRYEGSYMYAPGHRWGFFPNASIGWRISNESFFAPLKSVISDLKFRASWGQTAAETGVSTFGYLGGFNWASGSYRFNGVTYTGISARGLPVTNLSWVTNNMSNIGFDIALFNDKITGQFDVFERRRIGIPAARYDVLLPSEVGYSLPNENLNSAANRGMEGLITYNGKAGAVTYNIGVNATLSRSLTIETYKPRFGNSWDEYRTSSLGRWDGINWGYHILGQFQSMEQIADYGVDMDGKANTTLLPGDLIYEDLNGDKIINSMDAKPIGYATNSNPYLSFGLNSNVNYKGLGLALVMAGGTMQTWIRTGELKTPYGGSSGNSPTWLLSDRWHHSDPYDVTSPWVAGYYPPTRKDVPNHSNNSRTNDFYLTNVTYFRCASAELSYGIPPSLLTKARIGLTRARVYANITNPFSLDNVMKYETDPEINSGSGLVYPQSRIWNFGFSLTF